MELIEVAPKPNDAALEMQCYLEDDPENMECVDDCLAYGVNGKPPSYLTPLLAVQVKICQYYKNI